MNDPLLPILTLTFALASLLTGLMLLAFEIWMLVLSFKKSLLWFVVILVFPFFGSITYFYLYRPEIPKQHSETVKNLLIILAILWAVAGLILISPSLTN